MKSRKVVSAVLAASLLVTSQSYASAQVISGKITEIVKGENGTVTVITKDQKQIKKYSSTASSTGKNDSKVTLDASFIDDKLSSEMTTLISLKGFIPSGREIIRFSDYRGLMRWPYRYKVKIENISEKGDVQIVESIPKNTIENKEVSESVSYSIGGGVSVSDQGSASASLNANATVSKTVKYNQPDYITVKTKDTNNEVSWKTEFAETRDGYDVNSWNILYWNQMFMNSRYGGTSITNFTPDYKLSSLITGGFAPNMGLVLTGDNNAEKSRIRVTLERELNDYNLYWYTEWRGINSQTARYNDSRDIEVFEFEMDWQAKTIRPVKR